MQIVFDDSGQLAAPLGAYGDGLGRVYRRAVAHAALTRGDVVRIGYNEFGPLTVALAAGTDTFRVGVVVEDVASGGVAVLQTGGPCDFITSGSLSVAVGHGLEIAGGAVDDSGADFDDLGGAVFAVQYEATTSATTQKAILIDEVITEAAT